MMTPIEFQKRLKAIAPGDGDRTIAALDALVEEASGALSPDTFSAVFAYFEENPDVDLGSPGPLVQYLEDAFPEYIDDLNASLSRRPTFYALWMANRILNANIPNETRKQLMASLAAAADNLNASEEDRAQARHFLGLHQA